MNDLLTTVSDMWKSFAFISVADILDIIVIAVIIFKLIDLLRNTSAMQVVRGIVFILVFTALAGFFRLNMVSYFLSNTIQVGLIALIIVFQPELRRMLEQVGRSRFPNIFQREIDGQEIERVILQTVEACSAMSQSRDGALIIFERKSLLNDIVKTGTIIESEVSAELLKNIFYPKAPLHDGAAIIRDRKIAAAGCVLPLSQNTNLSRDLGMRHRAAIGMSETSDAIAVVVSEENGSISVAMGGMLKRHLAPETLEKLLRNELMPTDTAGKKRGFFFWLNPSKR